jgi:glycosyltransferase involved in cell wall biosynthesis
MTTGKAHIRVLMVTSEWPSHAHPYLAPHIVQQVDSLRSEGLDVTVFSFHGGKKPMNYLKAWFGIRKQYRMSRFDVLHAQFGQSGLLALPCRVPLVVTFHGSDLQGFLRPSGQPALSGFILRAVSRFVGLFATRVIIVSERQRKLLPSGVAAEVIPCGVDLNLFKPMSRADARRRLGLPLKKKLILFAANPFNPIKRYDLGEQAITLLRQRFDVDLVPVFDRPHKTVPLYMNACDVLLVTSKHEGSPSIVKEALACDLPIVSVDVGDVRERIARVKGCVLCDDDSPETISQGVAQVLKNGGRVFGRETVTDLERSLIARRIIDIYQSVVSRGGLSR